MDVRAMKKHLLKSTLFSAILISILMLSACLESDNPSINMMKKAYLEDSRVGTHIYFGKYDQDANKNNGLEDIEWRIIGVNEDKALIVSEYILTNRIFGTQEDYQWEKCELREWLNNDFMTTSFDLYEQEKIIVSDMGDHIFILSEDEVRLGFADYMDMQAYVTTTAIEEEIIQCDKRGNWWLRTPASPKAEMYERKYKRNRRVDYFGKWDLEGEWVNLKAGIRPAMWVDISVLETDGTTASD